MCVNFIREWPNDRFLRNFCMAGLFYAQSFCQKFAERKSRKKYAIRTRALRLINQPTIYETTATSANSGLLIANFDLLNSKSGIAKSLGLSL